MNITLQHNEKHYRCDLSHPIDISILIHDGKLNPRCYWSDAVKFETIRAENFIGSVREGGSVNHKKISLSPHGNGTHTECYGHLSADEKATIHNALKNFHFIAEIASVKPTRVGDDLQVSKQALVSALQYPNSEAVILRTLPNATDKLMQDYSGTNPPYLEADAAAFLVERGVNHLLIDLPSVDPEIDGGRLAAHNVFWNMEGDIRSHATITELIFVPDTVADGLYLLNLQIISLELDASPSKPIVYKLQEVS